MKSQILGVSALLFAAKEVIAADYLISDRYHLSKRQERSTKNITFAHINDVRFELQVQLASMQLMQKWGTRSTLTWTSTGRPVLTAQETRLKT